MRRKRTWYLTPAQLARAATVYCEQHGLSVALYRQRVEWETINAGLVVLREP